MKIVIANESGSWEDASTGKGHFVLRLITELREMGVKVLEDKHAKGDVCLHIGRVHFASSCRKNVIRVGPAHISTSEGYEKLNSIRRKSVSVCDAIVFQSEYSSRAYAAFCGIIKKPSWIIYNGMKEVGQSARERMIVCAARKWYPQKRLKSIIASFAKAELSNYTLVVLGNTLGQNAKYADTPRVSFIGTVPEPIEYFRRAAAVVHCVWVDACPNVVVESLACGTRVICTNQGGTKELVEGTDAIVLEDAPFKFRPVDLNSPPKLDQLALATAMRTASSQFLTRTYMPLPEKLRIDVVAKQYLAMFEEVLRG